MVLTLGAQGVEVSMLDLAGLGHQAIGLVVVHLLDRCCPSTTGQSGQDDQLHKPNSCPVFGFDLGFHFFRMSLGLT